METKTICRKCRKEFSTQKRILKDSREYVYSDNQLQRFCKVTWRKDSTKCQLCTNIEKALDYVNKEMMK